jgi:hypothetical protein
MTNSSAHPPTASVRTELVEISAENLMGVSRFISEQSHEETGGVDARLRWLLLDNPARELEAPLGWGLRASTGEFVGCILCVPQKFRLREDPFVVMGSSSFYVDEIHRGKGGLIFLKYSQLNSRWPLFGNSANSEAARLWKARGAGPIGYSDHELLGVINWGPIVEEMTARKTGGQVVPSTVGKLIAPLVGPFRRLRIDCNEPGELFHLDSAEQAMGLPVDEVCGKVTAVRDLPYLRWRYFSGRDESASVFAYRSEKLDKDILVSVNERTRGYRGQIRALNVLDIYPEVTDDSCVAIVAALLQRYSSAADVVVMRCQDLERQRTFRESGFLRREFEAPNAWLLDRFSRIPKCGWYLVPADGDWLI